VGATPSKAASGGAPAMMFTGSALGYTRSRMVWFTIWFLVILKIPIAYLGYIIWWAVKDPPAPSAGSAGGWAGTAGDGGGGIGSAGRRRRPPRPIPGRRPGPHGVPARRPEPVHARERAARGS
jgi:hypothetical protein